MAKKRRRANRQSNVTPSNIPNGQASKMDNLPPELLLKIAGYCNFEEVFALSKVNRRWNEVIESNWSSLKKTRVQFLLLDENCQLEGRKDIFCLARTKRGGRNRINISVTKGSENVDVADVFKYGLLPLLFHKMTLRPVDDDKFLEDLFAPIVKRSTIEWFRLSNLRSSTLQVLISLLERYRPTIANLYIAIGCRLSCMEHKDVQELTDSARIVELSSPDQLTFSFADSFTKEEVCEHFLEKIKNVYIPRVNQSNQRGIHHIRLVDNGPVPKCRSLSYKGSESLGISAFAVADMVDLVEEWCNNKRDIERYVFDYFVENINVVAKQFEQALKERNLPVLLEVVEENAEFLIKKIDTCGDEQDQLRINFGRDKGTATATLSRNRFVIMHTSEDDEVK